MTLIHENHYFLSDIMVTREGMATADNPRFLRTWEEVDFNKISFNAFSCNDGYKWYPYNKGGGSRKWFGLNNLIVNYENDGYEIKNNIDQNTGRIRSHNYNGDYGLKQGATWSAISNGSISVRYSPKGFLFDSKGSMGFSANLHSVIGLVNSNAAMVFLKYISPTLDFKPGHILQIPFIKGTETVEAINDIVQQNISIAKQDWDAHETSWDFQKNPLLAINSEDCLNELTWKKEIEQFKTGKELHILCGGIDIFPHRLEDIVRIYKTKWEHLFYQLHANEEELNRQFIDIYGLQDELTPDVPLDEITILQKGEIDIVEGEIVWNDAVIMKQLISYLVGCFMGRYSVDKPGLIIASQHQDLDALGLKVEGIENGAEGTLLIDDDGIIPILEGEYFPDDMTVRIEGAIKAIFGEENFHQNLRYLEEKLGKSLREYLYILIEKCANIPVEKCATIE